MRTTVSDDIIIKKRGISALGIQCYSKYEIVGICMTRNSTVAMYMDIVEIVTGCRLFLI